MAFQNLSRWKFCKPGQMLRLQISVCERIPESFLQQEIHSFGPLRRQGKERDCAPHLQNCSFSLSGSRSVLAWKCMDNLRTQEQWEGAVLTPSVLSSVCQIVCVNMRTIQDSGIASQACERPANVISQGPMKVQFKMEKAAGTHSVEFANLFVQQIKKSNALGA